jgi:hypothetical protein
MPLYMLHIFITNHSKFGKQKKIQTPILYNLQSNNFQAKTLT